jgi:hypothetical protein
MHALLVLHLADMAMGSSSCWLQQSAVHAHVGLQHIDLRLIGVLQVLWIWLQCGTAFEW